MKLATFAFAFAVMVASVCAARPPAMAPAPAMASTLHYSSIEDFVASPGFSILKSLFNNSNFADLTSDPEVAVTLFAPNDTAFTQYFAAQRLIPADVSNLDPDLVSIFLAYHTVPDIIRVEDMKDGEVLPTIVEGLNLTLHAPQASRHATSAFVVESEDEQQRANIIPMRYDIPAGASLIHVIDAVLPSPGDLLFNVVDQSVQGGQNGALQAAG